MFQLLILPLVPLLAQAPQQPPVFRSTTRLVQLNVLVQKDGKPVADLKAADFEVSEKGKPQTLAYFAMERRDRLVNPAMNLPPNIFSNRLGEHVTVPASVTVVLLDALNTRWGDQIYAKRQVARFLTQIQPTDRVALYSLGRGLRILHDYTTDSRVLVEKLRKWGGDTIADLEASAVSQDRLAEGEAGLVPADLIDAEQTFANFVAANRVLNTLTALEAIAGHLAGVPGRKNLVWVSGGFPLNVGFTNLSNASELAPVGRGAIDQRTFYHEITRAVRALNHANVAVYPVDARGLIADPRFSAENRYAPPSTMYSPPNLDTMTELAGRTGGRAFYNRNDLDRAIREVFADTEVTYTLAYYTSFEELDGKFRDVKVKVKRPGVQVRYRKGYFALAEMNAADEKAIQAAMRNAIWSPLDATGIQVNVRVDLVNNGSKLRTLTQVDPALCAFDQKDGRWHGRLDYSLALRDETGKILTGTGDVARMQLKPETLTELLKSGIIYHRSLDMKPGAKTLRVVVRDAASGLTGSVTVPLSRVVRAENLSGAQPAAQ